MKSNNRFYLTCGILMLVSEVWKQWTLTYLINNGSYLWWNLPFQLCSIPMYLCLLTPICSGQISSNLKTFLMDFGMLGGFFAFFDTSGMHYSIPALTIHSYVWHILLIVIAIYSVLDPKTNRSVRGYLSSCGIYLVCCLIATLFNVIFHSRGVINMFYISPYYLMHQKVFAIITDTYGNFAGLTSYIAASMIGAGLIHIALCHLRPGLSSLAGFLFRQ